MKLFLQRNEGWVVALVFAAIFAAGCVALQPKNFEEKVAAAYTTVTTVRSLALSASQAEKISVEELKTVQEQANHFRAAINVTRQIKATNPDTAEKQLEAVITALAALQLYLETK